MQQVVRSSTLLWSPRRVDLCCRHHVFLSLPFRIPPPVSPPTPTSTPPTPTPTRSAFSNHSAYSSAGTLLSTARRLSLLASNNMAPISTRLPSQGITTQARQRRLAKPMTRGRTMFSGGVILVDHHHQYHRHHHDCYRHRRRASATGKKVTATLRCNMNKRGVSGGSSVSRGSSSAATPVVTAAAVTRQTRPPVARGTVSPRRDVPSHIQKTPYFFTGKVPEMDEYIALHTPETLGPMREACVLARQILDLCCSLAKPGVTTDAIDVAAHAAIVKAGACPSPLNYHEFPKSVCSSVNEVACHAIPDNRTLLEGDLVSFDVSVFFKGFHGDNCATVGVGEIDAAAQRLVSATKEAMLTGVAACRPGGCLTDIGRVIHDVADGYGYGTVEKYCGHGVGTAFHMLPFVQHFRNNDRLELKPGMTFTVEPIFTEGKQDTEVWSDGWTVATKDGGRAAQFEHVVLITEDGHEILTLPELAST